MKYITEHDIRRNIKDSKYYLKDGYNLTPSAREYLNDKKIEIIREKSFLSIEENNLSNDKKEKYLLNKKNVIIALFLEKISEIMEWDYNLSKDLLEIYHNFITCEKSKKEDEKKEIKDKKEIKEDIIIDDEIINLRNSRVITKLNSLKMVIIEYNEYLDNDEKINKIVEDIEDLIHKAVGGK